MIFVLVEIKALGAQATVGLDDTVLAFVEVLGDPFSTNFDFTWGGLEELGELDADGGIEGVLEDGVFDFGGEIFVDGVTLGEEGEPETGGFGLVVLEGEIEHAEILCNKNIMWILAQREGIKLGI